MEDQEYLGTAGTFLDHLGPSETDLIMKNQDGPF